MPASFKINETTITQTIDDPWLKSKGIELLVKRDDLLHPLINGNKWRKLKYNLLQMQSQNKTELHTCMRRSWKNLWFKNTWDYSRA